MKYIIFLFLYSNLFSLNNPEICEKKVPFLCDELREEAHSFYHTKGEWAGIYTMEVEKTVEEKMGTCHMKYRYVSISNFPTRDIGYDYRIFYFTLDPKTCKWKAIHMGAYNSGKLAYD
ncbi:MAG: hypothetical protein SFU98_01970 [Leptospiraceae bacterium]|nr:hypothetical protein [Leptospiraceae bacterium]